MMKIQIFPLIKKNQIFVSTIRATLVFVCMAAVILLFTGTVSWYFDWPPMDQQLATTIAQKSLTAATPGTRLMFIVGDGGNRNERINDAKKKIAAIVNSGKYNVLDIDTYPDYGSIGAVIAYDTKTRGEGNNMRVVFVDDDSPWWYSGKNKAKAIETSFKEILAEIGPRIVRIKANTNRVPALFSAEVYYIFDPANPVLPTKDKVLTQKRENGLK